VRKEQLSLLAGQLKDGVPAEFIRRQLEVMGRQTASTSTVGTLGWVYFMTSGDAVKIGFSTDVDKRLNAVRSHTKKDVAVIGKVHGTRGLEQKFHKQFAHLAIGGEWFRPDPEMLHEIKLVLANAKRRERPSQL
jgi:hypothetical protein